MGDWREVSLGDAIELKRGYDLPQRDRRPGSVPLVSSSGITDSHSIAMVEGPGVVTGRYGTLGQVFYIPESFWPLNTTLYVSDFKGNDPRFISYFLSSIDFFAYSDKAAVPGLNRNHLHQARVRLPVEVSEQSDIASVLSTLDEKIDLNRNTNETLEKIGSALFRDWFIEFGPVHARVEGQSPYLKPSVWSLFPDELGENERPKGWGTRSVYGIADFANGSAFKSIDFSPDKLGLPVIKIAELKQGVNANTKFTTKELGDRYRIESNDILFSWSGNPDTSIDTFLWDGGSAWLNQHIFRVRENGNANRAIIFFQLKALRPAFAEIARDKQTTGLGHVTSADMKRLKVCDPPSQLAEEFGKMANPILERILENLQETHRLMAVRRSLLPKLLNGTARVKDAAKIVLEAM